MVYSVAYERGVCTVQVKHTVKSLENACHTWAPYRCVHGEALRPIQIHVHLTLPYIRQSFLRPHFAILNSGVHPERVR